MSRQAALPDGRVLEFPEGTPDAVIDRTVRRELGVERGADRLNARGVTAPSFGAPVQPPRPTPRQRVDEQAAARSTYTTPRLQAEQRTRDRQDSAAFQTEALAQQLRRSAATDNADVALTADTQSSIADITGESGGFFDRIGDLLSVGGSYLDSGASRLAQAIQQFDADTPLPWLSDEANARNRAESLAARDWQRGMDVNAEAIGAAQRPGQVTIDDVMARPSIGNIGNFALDTTITSAPSTLAAAIAAPLGFASMTGNIGQDRAQNDLRRDPTIVDMATAAPTALASVILDRLGLAKTLAPVGRNVATRMASGIAAEAGTEAAQEAIEYAGGSVGTETGFDPQQAAVSALAGAIGGSGQATIVTGTGETARSSVNLGVQILADRAAARQEAQTNQLAAMEAFAVPQSTGEGVATAPPVAPPPAERVSLAPAPPEAATSIPEPAPPSPSPEVVQQGAAVVEPAAPGAALQRLQASMAAMRGDELAAPAPRPLPDQPEEGARRVIIPGGGKIDVRSELVDANQVRFAEGVNQNRDRDRAASEAQIMSIVGQFDPEQLGDDNYSDRGAPIVGPDGMIESGNGRVMAINRVYDERPEAAQAYREFIQRQGFDTTGIERPVLVRRRITDLDEAGLRQFVTGSNVDTKQSLSAPEQANQDSTDILSPELMARYYGGSLASQRNGDFVSRFIANVPSGQRSTFMDEGGKLSAAGVQRIENAMLARAYGNGSANAKRFLSRSMEQTDNQTRTLTGALADVAPAWNKLTEAVREGTVDGQYDLTDSLMEAVALIADTKGSGESVQNILKSEDMYSEMDPTVRRLIEAFHSPDGRRMKSRVKIADMLERYAQIASEQRPTPDIFGAVVLRDPADVLAEALEGDQGDFLQAAEDRLDETDDEPASPRELDRAGHSVPDRGSYKTTFAEAAYTDRQSTNTSAIYATGLTPEKFNVLPPARKIALLRRAIMDLTGVEVTVAKDMPRQYAIDQMLDAHQTLQGMAASLGMSPRAIALDGRLKLDLVRKGKFLGMYNHLTQTITLPKRSNSFAHEWWHALDYMMLDQLTDEKARGISALVRKGGARFAPKNVREAFVNLMNTMYFDGAEIALKIMRLQASIQRATNPKQKATLQSQIDNILAGRSQAKEKSRYWRNAKKLDGPNSAYWTQPTEMLARAGEAFVAFRMAANSFGNEFVTKSNESYLNDADGRFREAFPQGEERLRIFDAFASLVDALNAEQILRDSKPGEVVPILTATDAAAAGPSADDVTRQAQQSSTKHKTLAGRVLGPLFGPDAEAISVWRHNREMDKEENENRARNPVPVLSQINNGRSLAFSAAADGVKMVAKRWKSSAVMDIHNHFAFDLGGSKRVDRTYRETVDIRENKALNPVMKELEAAGFSRGWLYKKMTAEQRDTLRRLLTLKKDQEADFDDMGLLPLATKMRQIYNDEWYENRNAGIELGYVADSGYLNRQIDRELVAGRTQLFHEQATKVYELVFDRDYGKDAASIVASDKVAAFVKQAAWQKNPGVKAVRAAVRKDGDVEAAIAAIYDDVRSNFARVMATEYQDAILHRNAFDDRTAIANPSAEKKRTLPAEADELLKEFYNPDPVSSFIDYMQSSIRRVEWAKRFGHPSDKHSRDSKAQQLEDRMAAQGVPESDRRYVWNLVDRMSDRYRRTGWLANEAVVGALALLRVKGTLAMMGRAVTLSTGEPLAMGMITGRPLDGARALARTWASVFRKGTRYEIAEFARAQGFIRHHLLEQFLAADRFGTTGDTPHRFDKLSAAMFRNSGLTFLTSVSDAAIADVGRRSTLVEAAHRVLEGGKRGEEAANLMRELGIRDPDVFAQALVDMNGSMPSDEWLKSPEGYDYNTAIYRLTQMTIQKPGAAELAPFGRNPLATYATYSITSFLQGAYRNLLKRNVIRGFRLLNDGDFAGLARLLVGTILSALLLYLWNLWASIAREEMMNPERQDEWEQEGHWWRNNLALAASRTFSFGAFDPLINSMTGLKYNRDLAYLPLGAYAGADAQNATNIARAFTDRNSDRTNTGEHNAVKAAWQLAGAPTLAAALASLPGGPLASMGAGAATAYVTSPGFGGDVATAAVGPKGIRTDEDTGEIIEDEADYEERMDDRRERALERAEEEDGD